MLKEIARLHGEISAEEPRKRTLLRVLDLDPTDAEAKQALAAIAAAKPAPRQPEPEPRPAAAQGRHTPAAKPPSEEVEASEDLSLLDEEGSDALLVVAEDSMADARESAAPSYSNISGLLIAAEGYESNGNYDQAEEALKNVLLFDEEHYDAHERLKDVYLATDRRVDAVRELLWLSLSWDTRDLERSRSFARAAFELAPRAEATRSRLEVLGLDSETGELVSQTEEVVFVDESLESFEADELSHESSAAALPEQPALPFAQLSARAPEGTLRHQDAAGLALDPLDIPFQPDDFEETAQPRRARRTAELYDFDVAALLDQPMSARDFDHGAGAGASGAAFEDSAHPARGDTDMAALLDAPISQDEFDAAPPARRSSRVSANLLDEPLDDFGLADDHFERSDLHEVTPFADALPQSSAAAVARQSSSLLVVDEDSYAELESEELEFGRPSPGTARTELTFEPDELPSLESEPSGFDHVHTLEAEHTQRELPSLSPEPLAANEQPTFKDYGSDDEYRTGEAPEPTVPAEPIPALLRSSSQANFEDFRPSAAAPVTVPAPAAQPSVATTPPEVMTPEIEEALDEAEFFASQGLPDEALEVVQEAILIYPGSAALKKRLLEYEAAADAVDEAAEQKQEELSLDESFDIAEQLASELAEAEPPSAHDDMVDVESVFAQFKKGVAQQIGEDDTDTHFDLGIAYKEMGLLDDAIGEFEVSARSPARACTALTMVGMCHLEKGDPMKAVSYFERALNGSVRGQAEELALGYEIGNAYEAAGQLDKALSAFERVAARDRTFRGVGGRLDQLKRRGILSEASRASR